MNLLNVSIGGASAAPQTWFETILPGLSITLGAGIVLFALNWFREWLTAYWKKKSEAEVLAFNLVTQLDKLVSDCAQFIDDPRSQDDEGSWYNTVKMPTILFPETTGWHVLPKFLQYDIRSIPNKIDVGKHYIEDLWRHGDTGPERTESWYEGRIRYSAIGLEACSIIDILADKYAVPLLDRGEWDPEDRFQREIDQITQKREEQEKLYRPVLDWLLPKVPIDELHARHAKLAVDLDAAMKKGQKAL